jgi:hypothetical protein
MNNSDFFYKEYTSEAGYRELAELVDSAVLIRNTRFYPQTSHRPITNDAFTTWNSALLKGIRRNDLTIFDISSNAGVSTISYLNDQLTEKKESAKYRAVNYQAENFICINFTIIDFMNNSRLPQLWFGWQMDEALHDIEGSCIQTTDTRMIEIYRDWHIRLFDNVKT